MAIIYVIHRSLTYILCDKFHLNGFQSGQYGDPPSFAYCARQAAVYVTSLTTMKLLVVTLFTVWPNIKKIGQWLLSWTGGGDAAQVILSVLFSALFLPIKLKHHLKRHGNFPHRYEHSTVLAYRLDCQSLYITRWRRTSRNSAIRSSRS